MNISSHLSTLRLRQSQLESQIHDAFLHHSPDQEVTKLKKKRLKIAEEIFLIESSMRSRRAA